MAITLVKLCEDAKQNYNMVLVGGKGGSQNTVRWVHMVEDVEVSDFLNGGELIFTTGIGPLQDEENMLTFVKRLSGRGASGVVFNIGPYIKAVPKAVIDYCDKHNFPVYTLPWKVHIIDISFDFCSRIIENSKTELSVSEALKNLIFSPEDTEHYRPSLEKNGFHDTSSFRVISIGFFRDEREISSTVYAQNQLRLWHIMAQSHYPASVIDLDSKLLVIRQGCTESQIKRMASSLTKAVEGSDIYYRIGVSDSLTGFACVPELYRQAIDAYITAMYERQPLVYYEDIGINSLILAVRSKEVLEGFVESTLGQIMEYDKKNSGNFTGLLKTYIENDGSVKEVAEKSGVHRNTVNNNMKQIKSILSCELSERKKAELLLAFRISDLMKFI